jgi:hypothetical protein
VNRKRLPALLAGRTILTRNRVLNHATMSQSKKWEMNLIMAENGVRELLPRPI